MLKTVSILDVSVDSLTMTQAVEKLKLFLGETGVKTIYTPNAEIIMDAQRDTQLKNILNQGDLVVADGAGVVLASRLLGLDLPEKVSGIDLVRQSFTMDAGRKIRYFLFGSKPGVAEAAGENLLKDNPGVEMAGYRNGYFTREDESDIINQINSSKADILLVALGAPKQEKWIHENRSRLDVKVCIGVGGSLDVFAGKVSPAPEWMRRNGFEWLYRLYKEPWRYKRMLKLPMFVITVLFSRFK